MYATNATDKEASFGQHSVVRETAVDETGSPYAYYRCVDCGKEQVNREAFTDETTDAHLCNGGDA